MTSKFALVIANTEYQDAEEFAHVLRDTEFAAFDDVQVLINESEGKTHRFIARFFAERKRDDLLLLYITRIIYRKSELSGSSSILRPLRGSPLRQIKKISVS